MNQMPDRHAGSGAERIIIAGLVLIRHNVGDQNDMVLPAVVLTDERLIKALNKLVRLRNLLDLQSTARPAGKQPPVISITSKPSTSARINNLPRTVFSLLAPERLARPIFQNNTDLFQSLTNGVSLSKVLVFTRLSPQLDNQLHQRLAQLAIRRSRSRG